MEINKRIEEIIEEIKEHFNNMSVEQFEENLIKAGINEIEPSGCEMILFENGSKIIPIRSKGKTIRSKGYHFTIE